MRLAAGDRLGPYEIVGPLGSADTSFSSEARQRFEREARTISQLSHPHICALYDVGESTGPESSVPSPYLVMERWLWRSPCARAALSPGRHRQVQRAASRWRRVLRKLREHRTRRLTRRATDRIQCAAESRLMMVPIETTPALRIGAPVALFDIDKRRPWLDFDVSPTGQFVAVVLESRASGQPLTVVVNGLAECARQ